LPIAKLDATVVPDADDDGHHTTEQADKHSGPEWDLRRCGEHAPEFTR
jgi:hypothetical protein